MKPGKGCQLGGISIIKNLPPALRLTQLRKEVAAKYALPFGSNLRCLLVIRKSNISSLAGILEGVANGYYCKDCRSWVWDDTWDPNLSKPRCHHAPGNPQIDHNCPALAARKSPSLRYEHPQRLALYLLHLPTTYCTYPSVGGNHLGAGRR